MNRRSSALKMGPVLVVSTRTPIQEDRGTIDENAKQLVLNAFREACHTSSQESFDAALDSYTAKYPHVRKDLAGHVVAHILAAAEF